MKKILVDSACDLKEIENIAEGISYHRIPLKILVGDEEFVDDENLDAVKMMGETIKKTGRVTIPTNLDVVPETIEILKRWGADAIRDCDGTEFPEELTKVGAKIYSTYYFLEIKNITLCTVCIRIQSSTQFNSQGVFLT